jgi:hypothetical protein
MTLGVSDNTFIISTMEIFWQGYRRIYLFHLLKDYYTFLKHNFVWRLVTINRAIK